MRSVVPMRAAKIGYIVMSVLLCLFGVFLIWNPDLSIEVIGMAAGICLILFGIVKLVGYFSKDLFRLAFQYDLAFGLLMIALGAIVLIKPDNLMTFLSIALGIAILSDGLFKIQISMDSRRFGIRLWWLILMLAVLTGVFGLVLVFRPTKSSLLLVTLFGISLLAEGILNLITVLSAVKIVKHQRPDQPPTHADRTFVDVDFEELNGKD